MNASEQAPADEILVYSEDGYLVGGTHATFKAMCELIAHWAKETMGRNVTPDQVFNYSPTGELFMVFHWYTMARAWKRARLGLPPEEVVGDLPANSDPIL